MQLSVIEGFFCEIYNLCHYSRFHLLIVVVVVAPETIL